jgi:hypothetical protein
MSGLDRFYADFAETVRGGDGAGMAMHLAAPEMAHRMAVYRNTALRGQIDALAAAYPSVAAAMGPERFEALGRDYVRSQPAVDRSFALYGAGLDAFIAARAGDAATLAIADLAALDRAWLEAHGAADENALPAAALAGCDLSIVRLCCAASVRCVATAFEVYPVWAALREGQPAPGAVQPEAGFVLVWRAGLEVLHRPISGGEAGFFNAIAAGEPLGAAVGAALDVQADFEAAGVFAGMLSAGLFVDFSGDLES